MVADLPIRARPRFTIFLSGAERGVNRSLIRAYDGPPFETFRLAGIGGREPGTFNVATRTHRAAAGGSEERE